MVKIVTIGDLPLTIKFHSFTIKNVYFTFL
jgi:hypothetical protein